MATEPQAPVRLCCGQRHSGVRCPDGLVMCSLCFGRFMDDQLVRDEHDPSKRWDVCLACASTEQRNMAEREFLAASVAVWRAIDAAIANDPPYKGLEVTEEGRELRIREREAWDLYRSFLDDSGGG